MRMRPECHNGKREKKREDGRSLITIVKKKRTQVQSSAPLARGKKKNWGPVYIRKKKGNWHYNTAKERGGRGRKKGKMPNVESLGT